MRMPMVYIWVVLVAVTHGSMCMRVDMRLLTVPVEIMLVLVMFVMGVGVRVLHRVVRVLVAMPLGHMKPHARRHHSAGGRQRPCHFILAERDCE